MPKEVKKNTIVRKSVLRPSILEIAINLALVYYEEPVNTLLKLLELQPYYSKTELLDNIKSK